MFRLKMKPSCSISNSLDKFLSDRNDEIVFGFGSEQKDVVGWMRITRDVATDIDKVLSMKKRQVFQSSAPILRPWSSY